MVINEDSHQEFFIRIWLLRLRIGLAQQISEGRRKNRFLRNYSKLVTPLKRLGKRNLFATFCWKSRVCTAKKTFWVFRNIETPLFKKNSLKRRFLLLPWFKIDDTGNVGIHTCHPDMLKLRHEFAVEAAKSLSCEEPTSLLCKHVIHPARGQGQCQADEVIFTSVLWGVSCNIFDVWVFSALQHSLGEDGGHSVLARVVPLQQHVLELRVHILNLLVHLLEKTGVIGSTRLHPTWYTIVLIVHYLRWRGCVHPGCSSWCASRSSRSRAPPPRCRSRSAAGLPRSSTWKWNKKT